VAPSFSIACDCVAPGADITLNLVRFDSNDWVWCKKISGENVSSLAEVDWEYFSSNPHIIQINSIGVYELQYNDKAADAVIVSTDQANCP
jgi:hypothetical protein